MINSFVVRTLRRAAVLVVATGAFNAPLQAQFYQNTTGLANAGTTITFSEHVIGLGTAITNQFAAQGITFGTGMFYNTQGPVAFPAVTGDYLGNFDQGANRVVTSPFSIFFNSVQTRAGWGVATNTANSTFEALLAGNVVASGGPIATLFSNPDSFFGFDGVAFDEIRFTVTGDHLTLIDNIQYGQTSVVPEPGTFALLGSLLIPGAAIMRRRRNRAK